MAEEGLAMLDHITETSRQRVGRLLDEFVIELQRSLGAPLEPFLRQCQTPQEHEQLLKAALPAVLMVAEANVARRHQHQQVQLTVAV